MPAIYGSDAYTMLLVASLVLLSAASIIYTVWHYRKKLQTIVCMLDHWSQTRDATLLVPVGMPRDTIVQNIVHIVRHGIERELLAERQLLSQEAVKDLAALSAQLVHDIKVPLAALHMVVRTLQNIPPEERLLIEQAVQRINHIADDVLQQNNLHSTHKITDIVHMVVSHMQVVYPHVSITLHISYPDMPHVADMPAAWLQRMLSNILQNSVEAMNKQPATIDVRVTLQSNTALVCVEDNGRGIEKHIIPLLLQTGATLGKPTGSGLGLAHAAKVLRACGGALYIASEYGIGTTVKIVLPCKNHPI